jgi:hypothetical protein
MENEPRPSVSESGTTPSLYRRFANPRTLCRALIGLAWMATIIALCYGLIKWRGGRAWESYRRNYESRVASLDFQTYIPKPVADAGNFAATPFIRSFFASGTNFLFDHDAFALAAAKVPDPLKNSPQLRRRNFMDLAAWQEAFAALRDNSAKPGDRFQTEKLDAPSRATAAPSVLEGLEADQAVLSELRAASSRPEACYPVAYNFQNPWVTLLPHLSRIKQSCARLQLQACAELALGQGDKALDDIKLVLYMANSLKTDPWVISYLVRLSCMHIGIQPIWEGLAEHRWSDGQLQQLQTELEQYNFLAALQASSHAQRALGVLFVDLLERKGLGLLGGVNSLPYLLAADNQALSVLGRMIPSGLYAREKLQYCLLSDEKLDGNFDGAAKRVYPRRIPLQPNDLTDFGPLVGADVNNPRAWEAIAHHQFIAGLLLPGMTKLPSRAAMAQTAMDEAAIACALERYRLANGQFPENLSALVPRWMAQLPKDTISGEPYKYRRTADGLFLLYCVGWNEKDDGGAPGKFLFDTTEGDWLWQPSFALSPR